MRVGSRSGNGCSTATASPSAAATTTPHTTASGTARSHHTRDRPTSRPTPPTAPTASIALGSGPVITEASRNGENGIVARPFSGPKNSGAE